MSYLLIVNKSEDAFLAWDADDLLEVFPWAEEAVVVFSFEDEQFYRNDLDYSVAFAINLIDSLPEAIYAETTDGSIVGLYTLHPDACIPDVDKILEHKWLVPSVRDDLREISDRRSGVKISMDVQGSKILFSAAR
jgi:hypothetical protein